MATHIDKIIRGKAGLVGEALEPAAVPVMPEDDNALGNMGSGRQAHLAEPMLIEDEETLLGAAA
jgi:hypothetical protein